MMRYLLDTWIWVSFALGFCVLAVPMALGWMTRLIIVAFKIRVRGKLVLVKDKVRANVANIIGPVVGLLGGVWFVGATFYYNSYIREHFAQDATPYLLAWVVGAIAGVAVGGRVQKIGPGWQPLRWR